LRSADGSQERRLTKRDAPEFDAIWSPDGRRLVFAFDKMVPNQGDMDVYTIGVDGEDLQPVAVTAGKLSHEEWPDWSPDGDSIAFSSTRDGNQEIYVVRPDGKELRRLTQDPAIDAHPAWSPDGKRLAFATSRWGDLEIAVISADGSGLTRLTTSRGLDDYPTWSPDGTRIAFTSNRDGNMEIFAIGADGKDARNLTSNPAIDNFPTWTHDGDLTFVSNRDGGFDIYTLLKPGR
jgi:TolB protein